ncbi:hypothetical protein FEI17_11275 [Kosakonia radicincitans]|nr:hypothetical protein FEI17_11275 [Kosakonia radicincitans]
MSHSYLYNDSIICIPALCRRFVTGFMSQNCNEVDKRALRRLSDEFIIKTDSEFYKTHAMR